MAAGLLVIAAGLWQLSGATIASTYVTTLPGMIMLGIGAGLAMPCATASVMGSLPQEHTGVGSATNGTFMQVGGALGVAVIGSLLSTRYQGTMSGALTGYHLPGPVMHAIRGSVGGALGVAAHAGGTAGAMLAHLARTAFMSGMDLGLRTGAAVAVVAGVVAFAAVPSRAPAQAGPAAAGTTLEPEPAKVSGP